MFDDVQLPRQAVGRKCNSKFVAKIEFAKSFANYANLLNIWFNYSVKCKMNSIFHLCSVANSKHIKF